MLIIARRIFTDRTPEVVTLTVPPSDEPTTVEIRVTRTGLARAWLGIEAPRKVLIVRSDREQEAAE